MKVLQVLSMYDPRAEDILKEEAEVVQTERYDHPHLVSLAKDVDAILLRAPARITKEIIDAATQLKVISGAGTGVDNIDVSYATQKGIPVLHAPSVNAVSTAEHAMTLILALGKSLVPFDRAMRKGDYASRNRIVPFQLKRKKVGLVGFGHIACELAGRLSKGMDMDVTAWTRTLTHQKREKASALGIQLTTDLESLFAQSDFVSVHLALNEETRGMIDHHLLSRMKKNAFIVNTSRGAIIKQEDLMSALREGTCAGAGLDVYDPEPPDKDDPLLSLPNVMLTPHVGGLTAESRYQMSTRVAKNILDYLKGGTPEYIANPEVFNTHH
ncbi:hydroxyacid dehydrogenase [Sporolactobacillus sp. THM7-7]|nr:hydroxyacid dehydrogenase [Sporolactobacillus sp. THM7-7]